MFFSSYKNKKYNKKIIHNNEMSASWHKIIWKRGKQIKSDVA